MTRALPCWRTACRRALRVPSLAVTLVPHSQSGVWRENRCSRVAVREAAVRRCLGPNTKPSSLLSLQSKKGDFADTHFVRKMTLCQFCTSRLQNLSWSAYKHPHLERVAHALLGPGLRQSQWWSFCLASGRCTDHGSDHASSSLSFRNCYWCWNLQILWRNLYASERSRQITEWKWCPLVGRETVNSWESK